MAASAQLQATKTSGAQLDLRILKRLAEEPTALKADIAAALNVPEAAVATRLQALATRGAFQVRPVLNVNRAARVFVFCRMAVNSPDLSGTLRRLAAKRELFTVASLFGGRYNALVYFTYGDMAELHRIVSEVILEVGGIAEMETSIISDSLVFRPEYIGYPGQRSPPSVSENIEVLRHETQRCDFDDLDIRIISELQCEPQKSIRAIARDCGLSHATIRYRLRRLETTGAIRYITLVAHRELGLSAFAIVDLQIEPQARESIVHALHDKPWMSHLLGVAGASHVIAFINTGSIDELQQILSNHIRSLAHVKHVNVQTLLEAYKLDPRWGFIEERL